jgi:peptide/nickel transport system substrate-binding protein
MRVIHPLRLALVCGFALLAGCTNPPDDHHYGGTIVISASSDADILLPPLTMTAQGKQISDQIFDNLADVGEKLNTVGDEGFKPRLARSWKWAPDSSWLEFSLDSSAKWHDGAAVTSDDVRFTFSLVKSEKLGSQLASNLDEVDSVSTPDTHTARVWLSSHPTNLFFRVASPIAILPAHLLRGIAPEALRNSSFSRKPIGSGRFRFASWNSAQSVTLVADSGNYRGRPSADRIVWVVSPDYDAAALKFLTGDADFLDVVRPEFIARAAKSGRRVDTSVPSLNYGYIAFNLVAPRSKRAHPIFGDRNVRRALAMSLDREAMVRNVFDSLGMVAHGPVTSALPTSDRTTGLAFDTALAGRMLDSAGWKRGSDGMRAKNGKALSFTLLVPSTSATRMKFATLLQEQWRRIGANVKIDAADLANFGGRLEAHDFDAMLNAWQIDPDPGSVRDEWMSPDKRPGGINFASYSNPQFDATIDSAAHEVSADRAAATYGRAYRILTEDAPAVWLYESRNAFGIGPRLKVAGLRADAWWADLPDWQVTVQK